MSIHRCQEPINYTDVWMTEIGGGYVVKELRVFKGYIVDERLREFRVMNYGEMPEFIPFDSPKGQELLSDMEAEVRS